MKILLVLGAVLVLGLVVAIFWINTLAKTGIERGATYALGVNTQLDEAKVGIYSGQFAMSGLKVDNPPDFTTPFFMRLKDGEVAVSLGSLTQDQIELPLLALSGIDIYLEYNGKQGNYDVILQNLQNLQTPSSPDQPQPDEPEDQAPEESKKFVIRQIAIRDINVHADVKIVGDKPTQIDLNIPEIRLKDVGSGSEGGVMLSQLSGVLIKAILEASLKQGGDLLPEAVLGGLGSGLQEIEALGQGVVTQASKAIDDTGKTLDDTGKAVQDVTKKIEQTGKQLEENLGGLLKGLDGSKNKKDQ